MPFPGTLPLSQRRRLLPHAGRAADKERLRSNHALTALLASQVLSILALGGQVNWLILSLFLVCAGWRMLAERRGWALPSLLVRLAIFAPAVSAVAFFYGLQPTAGSLMALLVVLLALKFLEVRTTRDFTVVALLGYFMVLSALFYDQNFALCLYLSLAVLLNTAALISVHLGTGGKTVWPSLRLAGGLLLQTVPLVVLLFIIFPRVQMNFLRKLSNANSTLSGMSDHLQPGSIEKTVLSGETAFRAKIVSAKPPVPSELYWRGIVLSRAEDAMSWRAEPLAGNMNQLAAVSNEPPPGSIEQDITVMPQGDPWLFALDRPVQAAHSSLNPHLYLGAQQLTANEPVNSKANYVVFSRSGASGPGKLSPQAHRYYTVLPPGISPRVIDLVKGWQPGAPSPAAVILRALTFFGDGHFAYTLEPGSLPAKGGLDTFLFQTRRGFCEHYAAAFCSLMRVAGIPSRLIVGYQGGELNTLSGYYSVHQSDAHAWCEVWSDAEGWHRIDPTASVAPGRVSLGADSFAALASNGVFGSSVGLGRLNSIGWVRWLSHNTTMAWEGLDQQWNLMVIGYDPDTQFAFMENLGIANVSWLVGVSLALAGIFSTLIVSALLMRMAQGLSFGRKSSPDDAIRNAYHRFCQRLLRATGLRRAPAEGPLAYAARAADRRPDLAADIRRITAMYVQARYALPVGDSAAGALLRAMREFRPAPVPRTVPPS